MKQKAIFTVFTLIFLVAGIAGQPNDLIIDYSKSIVSWNGKKVTGEHSGKIQIKNGNLVLKQNEITGGTLEMDMNSITNEDLKDAGMKQRLVGHLKSDDFFSVAKFPVSTLVLTNVKKLSPNESEFTGNLTIKGITNPVTFKATTSLGGNELKANGKLVINRAKYDVRYGSGSFFEGLGDRLIYDDFTLEFNLVANRNK
jgi:polyisoprenoid-binding protein YceI